MYTYNRKKEIIKNVVFITAILLLAVVSTYHIYEKFQVDHSIDFNSESLDVIYHETTGDKLIIDKVTPVTDSVGLSSKSYNITIKNNLTEDVNYKIKIVDDLEIVKADECGEYAITKDDIRISIKNGTGENKIYNLNELEEETLFLGKIKALDKKNLAVRIWIKQDSTLPHGSSMHYHGLVQVVEDDGKVAINK